MNEVTIIGFKNSNGIRIAPNSDITTGKVIINGIEITSTEDWEKVTKSLIKLEHNWNELKSWLEEEIYKIEPKGTAINYNCEYDSEEDYINAMKERSKLITLKRVLIMLQSLEEGGNNENN